jgi:hypothetical protein
MRKTVFISSTYADLKSARRAVWDLLEEFQVDVRGMEDFGARTEAPLETCLAEVDVSDVYIGMVAMRLGSIDRSTGKSFTQLEYERAAEHGKEILIYLIDEEQAQISPSLIDFGEKHEKLVSFKKTLRRRHTVSTFRSSEDLVNQLRRDFQRLLTSKQEREGPVDTFAESKAVLQRFCLLPKDTSGTEIRLKVRLQGQPYPASKLICEAFNLDFGSTIGIEAPIVQPEGFRDSGIDHLYVDAKQADAILGDEKGKVLDIWAKVQFADLKAVQERARFTRERELKLPPELSVLESLTNLGSVLAAHEVVHEPDAKLILLFTRYSEYQQDSA